MASRLVEITCLSTCTRVTDFFYRMFRYDIELLALEPGFGVRVSYPCRETASAAIILELI